MLDNEKIKVRNMTSNSGNKIANQFIISASGIEFFQSYDSIIVKKASGRTILDEIYWNYSPTTSKYRNLFLGETTKETQAKIDSGEYFLRDLN